MQTKEKYLILGIGNLLMGDEGLGVHLIQELEKEDWPANVVLLDGGTGGFHLMEHLESYPVVIMIDATMDGKAPGAISLIEPKFASDFPRAMSSHDIGLRDLIEGLAILGKLPKFYLFTVTVESIQPHSIELSAPIRAALPMLQKKIKKLLVQLSREKVPFEVEFA